jgi:hypothetical protein
VEADGAHQDALHAEGRKHLIGPALHTREPGAEHDGEGRRQTAEALDELETVEVISLEFCDH